MTSQLMLVIVLVVAGLAIAAVASLRPRNTLHRPPEGQPAADLTRTAAKEPGHSGSDPQPPGSSQRRTHEVGCSGQALPQGPPDGQQQAVAVPEPSSAQPPTPRVESPSRLYGDDCELDFTLGMPVSPVLALQPAAIFSKLFDLALGKARPATTVAADHNDVAAAVGTVLPDIATRDRYAPRRPNMLPKVLSASNDDSFSRRELATLIARDPSLVGNLLKIANSSYYRVTPEPIESVDRAVVLLGTDGIRSLVTAALMQPIFRIGGADFPRFPEIAWEHTFRSASAAVPYNFLLEKSDPFVAELLSLVLGLAAIVIFRVTIDQYAKYPRLRPDAGVVSSLLDKHSATVARQIAVSWELSPTTLSGLDGQTTTTTSYPTALGRSVYFGRVVGALAVLRINDIVDDETAKASIPATTLPEAQLERLWARLTPPPRKQPVRNNVPLRHP